MLFTDLLSKKYFNELINRFYAGMRFFKLLK